MPVCELREKQRESPEPSLRVSHCPGPKPLGDKQLRDGLLRSSQAPWATATPPCTSSSSQVKTFNASLRACSQTFSSFLLRKRAQEERHGARSRMRGLGKQFVPKDLFRLSHQSTWNPCPPVFYREAAHSLYLLPTPELVLQWPVQSVQTQPRLPYCHQPPPGSCAPASDLTAVPHTRHHLSSCLLPDLAVAGQGL